MNLSDYIINFFENKNIHNIFTVTGGGSIFLCDALTRAKKLKYICNHHEQAVAFATEGYSRFSNSVGVSLVTTGPGGTNAITGTAACWIDSIPSITISGQVFLNQTISNTGLRQLGIQEINIIDIVKPITKYAVMIKKPEDIKYHLEKAYYLSLEGRPGPVWLDIPANIQNSNININNLKSFSIPNKKIKKSHLNKNNIKIKKIIGLLNQSKRPLIHVGHGVRLSKAGNDLLNFIEKNNLPIATTWNAADIIPNDHRLFVGRPGTFAGRGVNFAVQKCDLYIAIGTRLPFAITGYNSKDYARNAFKVMVDIDSKELNKKSLDINLKVNMDAKKILFELSKHKIKNNEKFNDWISICQNWNKRFPVIDSKYQYQKKYVNSYFFVDVFSNLLKNNSVILTDMGLSFVGTYQAFKVKKGQKLFTNSGHAPMGWGLPASIGASIANKRKKTYLLTGEGGLQMNIQEFATIMHEKLPIKVFIFNNGGYLTIKQTQELGFKGRIMGSNKASGISFPNYKKTAESYKIGYIKIKNNKNLEVEVSKFINKPGPGICELMMSPNQPQVPKAINKRLPSGEIEPSKLDDLFPFLSRERLLTELDL